jgi:8-oxo-dGTP diphosphatase
MTRAGTQALAMHQVQLIVDVYLLLVREDQILLGRRTNTGYGDGAYEPVSGRLAERETIVEAALRVARSQAGIRVAPAAVSLAHVMHDVSGSGRIAFFLAVDEWEGEPRETTAGYSDLCWFPLDGLPANMIDRARVAIRNYAQGARMSTYPAFDVLAVNSIRYADTEVPRFAKRDLHRRGAPGRRRFRPSGVRA